MSWHSKRGVCGISVISYGKMQRLVLWTLTDVVPKYHIDCSWNLWSLLLHEIVIAVAWCYCIKWPRMKSWCLSGNQFLVCSIWMKFCPQLHTYELSAAPGLGAESCVISFFPAKYTPQPYFPFENVVRQGLHHLLPPRFHWSSDEGQLSREGLSPDNLQYKNMPS